MDSQGRTQDAVFSADYGSGFVPLGIPGLISGQIIAFNGISVTIPPSGNIKLKVSNIRANVNQFGSTVPQQILGQIAFSSNASILVNQSPTDCRVRAAWIVRAVVDARNDLLLRVAAAGNGESLQPVRRGDRVRVHARD